jgi:hypothetical protein
MVNKKSIFQMNLFLWSDKYKHICPFTFDVTLPHSALTIDHLMQALIQVLE